MEGSYVEIENKVIQHHLKACKIPKECHHMIIEIVQNHMKSLSQALGNLELIYRRTLDK